VATGRARRPDEFAKHRVAETPQPKSGCPFERLLPDVRAVYDRRGGKVTSGASSIGRWWVQVVPNKYPAFSPSDACPIPQAVGPYHRQDGVGLHEVVITRHHTRALGSMTSAEVAVVLRAYRDRYLALRGEGCVRYISIFHNHGRAAGATISHPHSQIIAIPVIPPDVERSLRGSATYFKKHRKCVHCVMLDFERRQGWRIVYENESIVALCPYISRSAFEVRVFPKRHAPAFERMSERELDAAGDALRTGLAKLARGLGDPA
jgi:UDPglucose--hexose-1-phosphate uridylyltransferase